MKIYLECRLRILESEQTCSVRWGATTVVEKGEGKDR